MHIDRPKAKRTRDLCRGPGRLRAAMAVDRSLDGLAIGLSNDLIEPGEPVEDRCCITGPRIGLGHTGPWMRASLFDPRIALVSIPPDQPMIFPDFNRFPGGNPIR